MPCRFEARRCLLITLVVGAWLCSLATVASAQGAAGILGQVKDESGGILPGVTVTATSPSLQVKEVSDVTNAQGEYRLTPLPIGTYVVLYTLQGFQTIRQENVRLEVGVQARLDVVLKVGTIAETVTVSGAAPVVDVTATSASTQLNHETLELTPTARNGIVSLGTQAPGVKGILDIGGGQVGTIPVFKVFGMSESHWVQMEGLNTNDLRMGGSGGNYFDYESIDEARIQTISNGPEIGGRGGVSFTLVAKSGGNQFHGSAQSGYMNSRFQSNNINAALRAQGITSGNPLNKRTDYGGDLGGYIVKNKVWFYGAGRYRQQDITQLGGFKPDGTAADAYRGEIITSGKLSYQMSASNKLVSWGQWNQKYQYGDNVSKFVAWESRTDRGKGPVRGNPWKLEWQSVRGNSLVLSALFGDFSWHSGNSDTITHSSAVLAAGVPEGYVLTMLSDASHAGNSPSIFDLTTGYESGRTLAGGQLSDIHRWDTSANLSWFRPNLFLGNHEFKAGFEYEPYHEILGNGDRGGAGNWELLTRGGVPGPNFATPHLVSNGDWTQLLSNAVPFEVNLYNYPVVNQADINVTDAYANDSWTIARRLTLDLGLRYQRDNAFVPPQCRLAGTFPWDPASCIGKVPFGIYNAFTPRVYYSYDVTGNAKTVLKGGWGRFLNGRTSDEVRLANPYQSATLTYRWHNPNNLPFNPFDSSQINLDPNGPDFVSTTAPALGTWNPNQKQAGTDQMVMQVERQLASNLAVRATAVYVRTFNSLAYLNTQRPPSAYTIPVTNPNPVVPGTFLTYYEYPATLAGQLNEKWILTNDPTIDETHKNLEFALTKRLSNRWQLLASYAVTKNHVPLPTADLAFTVPLDDPNQRINTANNTWEWIGKASGTYVFPVWGVSASFNFDARQGNPQAPQVLATGGKQIPSIVLNTEPLGSIKLPNTYVTDVRFDKSFALSKDQRLAIRLNVYNIMNASTILARNLRVGSTYLLPSSIMPPRIVEVGGTYTF
jgi:carboxypeptidase family protein